MEMSTQTMVVYCVGMLCVTVAYVVTWLNKPWSIDHSKKG